MLIKNQNHPDFLKTRFLLAGFYCGHDNEIAGDYNFEPKEKRYIEKIS